MSRRNGEGTPQEAKHTIAVLVENKFGVLARIASLFSGRGYNIHSLAVIRLRGPFHNSRNFPKLPPHFFHHISGHFAHRFHCISAEKIRKKAADKESDNDKRVA